MYTGEENFLSKTQFGNSALELRFVFLWALESIAMLFDSEVSPSVPMNQTLLDFSKDWRWVPMV
jgi:hypothetical protein